MTNLVGKTAMDLVLELPCLQRPRAEFLRFVVFTPYQGLEARLKLEPEVTVEHRPVTEILASKPPAELVAELLRHEAQPTREVVDIEAGSLSKSSWTPSFADYPRARPSGYAPCPIRATSRCTSR